MSSKTGGSSGPKTAPSKGDKAEANPPSRSGARKMEEIAALFSSELDELRTSPTSGFKGTSMQIEYLRQVLSLDADVEGMR